MLDQRPTPWWLAPPSEAERKAPARGKATFRFIRTEAPDSPENHAQLPFRPGGPMPK